MRFTADTRHVEVAEDVRLERSLELFVCQIFDRLLMLLICGVVHQNVDPAKHVDRRLDRRFAERRVAHVAGKSRQRRPSATTALSVTSASLCSSGKYTIATSAPSRAYSTATRASDSRIAACDQRDASIQLS